MPCQTDPLLEMIKTLVIISKVVRKFGYGRTVVIDFEARLQSILAALEECRLGLLDCASPEAAHLLALATLEIRMKLNRVSDSELKALCDAIAGDQSQAEVAQEKALRRSRWRPALKVVK